MTPKISVLIPTYNRADYLRTCIGAAQAAPPNSEILVVDNASTDGTAEMVYELAARDSRIRYLRNPENLGMIPNFERAFNEARGEYVTLVCDDDLHYSEHYATKIALLDRCPQIGLVYSTFLSTGADGEERGACSWEGLVPYSYVGGRNEFLDLLVASYMLIPTVVMRRELVQQVGGFRRDPNIVVSADWDFLLRVCRITQTAYINEPMVGVRFHEQSYSTSTAKRAGEFAKCRLAIWQKWLVDDPEPLMIGDHVWERMKKAFVSDLKYEFDGDRDAIYNHLHQLENIQAENHRRHTLRARARVGAKSAGSSASSSAPAFVGPARSGATPTSADIEILYTAPVFDPSGYATEARSFISALDASSFAIRVNPVQWSNRRVELAHKEERRLSALMQTPILEGGRPLVNLWHIFPPSIYQRVGEAQLNVCRVMYETDRIPANWVADLNKMDEIWVPSEHNLRSFAASGVDPHRLVKVPGMINADLFDPEREIPRVPIDGGKGFNFLSVFDWQRRKGWQELLRAYASAFTVDEDVALVLKTHSSFGKTTEEIGAEIVGYLGSLGFAEDRFPNVILQDMMIPADLLPALYRSCDAFVLPTHGEGWGYPYMEAMAMGLPTIGTNWGANIDFMTPDNSYLIDVERIEEVQGEDLAELPSYAGHQWAVPSVDSLSRLMRHVFEHREEAAEVGRRASQHVRTLFSQSAIAAKIRNHLEARLDFQGQKAAPTVNAELGGIYREIEQMLALGNSRDASQVTAALVGKFGTDSYAWVLRARSLRLTDRFSEAGTALSRAQQLEETPEALYEQTLLCRATNEVQRAETIELYLRDRYPGWVDRNAVEA